MLTQAGLDGIAQGLHLAGIFLGIVLTADMLIRVRHRSAILLPILFFLTLMAGFASPLVEPGSGIIVPIWLLKSALPAFGYLLVLQLVTDHMPRRPHFLILLVPALAIPVAIAGAAGSEATICIADDCIMPRDALALYDVLAGGFVLLALMFVIRNRLPEMEEEALGREKRALVVTLVALLVTLLALDLATLFGWADLNNANLAATIVRLTFFYLVASSIYRVFPSAFSLPEPPLPEREVRRLTERKALSDEEERHLARIKDLMSLDKLYQEPGFSRKQLADEIGIPEHQLSRIINTGLGKSFTDLINHHRVSEAKQLLRDTEQPVSQIAFDVGFNSLASFNRVFKTATDLSPSAYRRQAADGTIAGEDEDDPETAAVASSS